MGSPVHTLSLYEHIEACNGFIQDTSFSPSLLLLLQLQWPPFDLGITFKPSTPKHRSPITRQPSPTSPASCIHETSQEISCPQPRNSFYVPRHSLGGATARHVHILMEPVGRAAKLRLLNFLSLFRDLQKPTRFSGGGVVSRIFP